MVSMMGNEDMQVLAWPRKSSNPYTSLIYNQMSTWGVKVDEFSILKLWQNRYTIWHIHWPERVLNDSNPIKAIAKTITFWLLVNLARTRGTKIVWTVHNLAAHEGFYPRIEEWFWRVFTHKLDGYISLSKTGLETAQKRFFALNNLPGFVIPHSHYRGEYLNNISSGDARAKLGIPHSAKILLAFGKIRAYKNLPELIRIFRQLKDPHAQLYIVGNCHYPTLKATIEQEADGVEGVKLQWGFVPQEQAQLYFQAADLVVAPYRQILNSGTALLALSFNRPILVPQLGSMGELQTQVGEEWVHTYKGKLTVFTLEKALDWALQTSRPAQAPLEAFDPQYLAQKTLDAYCTFTNISEKKGV